VATDAAVPPPDAGFVYRAAVVRSGVPGAGPTTGLWIRDGRIVAVGVADDLVRAAGGAARQVSLAGATILPGFVDAHCHVSMLAYLLNGADCSPEAAPDVASILDRLARTPPAADGWVTGSGYAEYQLRDLRHPTRAELDEAVPGSPCVLYHRSMHTCVVNSAGLAALGFDDGSPDPPRGMLGRAADGRLDGRLLESVMFDLMSANMRRLIDALDGPGKGALVRRVGEHLAARGVTTAADAAADAGAFLAFREAERRGELPIRVTAMFTYPEAAWLIRAGMTTGFGSERLRIGAIKLFADGGLSSRTAAVEQPYETPPHDTGMLWYEPDALAAVVRECAEAGFSVGVHAQGERAIRATLDAFGAVTPPGNPLRHRIEHGGLFRADLREQAARIGIHVVSQPAFLSAIGDGYYEAIGPARAEYLYPYRSLIDAGILLAGSSDAPVIDASPLVALRDAVLRRTDGGVTIGAAETLSMEEALAVYTRNAAYAEWSEGRIGTLEPGALADFVALDRDPLEVPAADVADAAVLLTVVGGQVVHDGRTAAVA
jgi:predicted amidohydrolase YtcJ